VWRGLARKRSPPVGNMTWARHFELRDWLFGLGCCASCAMFFALWMASREVTRASKCRAKRRCSDLVRAAWSQKPQEAKAA
jgi:hypothetical protein